MIYDEYYKKIESILLENVLQEHIWNYFLATEVWCLLLRYKKQYTVYILQRYQVKQHFI